MACTFINDLNEDGVRQITTALFAAIYHLSDEDMVGRGHLQEIATLADLGRNLISAYAEQKREEEEEEEEEDSAPDLNQPF